MDAAAVALVRAGLREVAPRPDALMDDPDALVRRLHAELFARAPELRAAFPAELAGHRRQLGAALRHVGAVLDDPDRLAGFVVALGREHRRHAITPAASDAFGLALRASVRALRGPGFTDAEDDAWAQLWARLAGLLARGAAGDGPTTWDAVVVEHERRAEDLAVVRLQVARPAGASGPVPALAAGQHLAAETERRPGRWRTYSPATAPNDEGQVELHVRAVPGGWVSPAVVAHTRPGDRWRLASPGGDLRVDLASGRDVLMVAGGTGLAPLRSLLGGLARRGDAPRVHLFVGGRHPGDLYDLDALAAVAATNPWLTVVPVVEREELPFTRFPPRAVPDGVQALARGRLVDVVTRHGSWADRQALVCGSPGMVRATVDGLVAAGMPAHHVWHDPLPGVRPA